MRHTLLPGARQRGHSAVIEAIETRRYLAADVSFAAPIPYGSPNQTVVAFTISNFNNNSSPDLGVLFNGPQTGRGQFAVLLGQGNGSFLPKWSTSVRAFNGIIRAGDWNNDQKSDFYYSYGSGFTAFSGDDNGNQVTDFERAQSFGTGVILDYTTADMNGDGSSDVLTVGTMGLQVSKIANEFHDYQPTNLGVDSYLTVNALFVTQKQAREPVMTVFSGGKYSIAVLTRPAAGGDFYGQLQTSVTLSGKPSKLRSADFNGDGKLDVAVLTATASGPALDIAFGAGNGKFASKVTYSGIGNDFTLGDFDYDGRVDVAYTKPAVAGNTGQAFALLRNRGDGAMEYVASPRVDAGTDMIDSADFNNDGKPDLILRDQATQTLKVVLNTATPKNVIRGTIYNDVNQDGVRDPGEALLEGRTVYLDQNTNGIQDRREAATTTNIGGWYEFRVTDGTYFIREALPGRWLQSAPANAAGKTGANIAVVSGNVNSFKHDFGTYDRGTISGAVYNDTNANGIFDNFESGRAGITVFLDLEPNNHIDTGEASTVTDAQGRYHFNVGNGIYYVNSIAPRGYQLTYPKLVTATINNNFKADVNLGQTRPATISGHVYYDYDTDGFRDDNIDVGVGGLQVFVDLDNDGVLDSDEESTFTSNSRTASLRGGYSFPNLYPDTYTVRLIKPAGYQQIAGRDSHNAIIVPAAGPGTGGPNTTFAFGGSETVYSDFGVIRPIKVSGRAYGDTNANGRINAGEVGIGNTTVFIDYNSDGVADLEEPQTVTDAAGNYTLSSSRPGTFNVRAILGSGVNATRPGSPVYSVTFVDGAAISTDRNFGLVIGAFSTAPYADPVNTGGVANPTALASGDFNGDRRQDVVVAGNAGQSRVYLGNGRGAFTPGQTLAIGSSTRYMIAVDVSGDGKPDLIGANEAVGTGATVLINNGNGTFANAVEYDVTTNTYGVAAADFNGDGKIDLAYVGTSDTRVAILINKGNGTFNNAVYITNTFGGRSIAAGDVNGDRKADLVVAHPNGNAISVLLGNGSGGFTRVPTDITSGLSRPTFISLSDFNNDGKLDIVVVNESADDVRVKLGLGNGTFADGVSYSTASTPTQVAVLDIDSDGKLDLIVSCRSDGTTNISGGVSIIRGRGDGSFVEQQVRTAHTSPTAVAIADFNGDRRLDILAANFFSDDVSLLVNDTGA